MLSNSVFNFLFLRSFLGNSIGLTIAQLALVGWSGKYLIEPSLEEISKELELPQEDVSEAMDAVCAPVSLYDPVYADGSDPLTVMDQVRDTRNTDENWLERIALRDAFHALGEREKRILSMRFVGGKTQMEVADLVGISQAQVSRLEKNAISAMRKSVAVS